MNKGLISAQDIALSKRALQRVMQGGASAARVSLSVSEQNSISVLDGDVDKITYSSDRSLFFHIFKDGRYGTFSTNRLEDSELDKFISRALDMVVLLGKDEHRQLPDPRFKAVGCTQGDELDLVDSSYGSITQEQRTRTALDAARSVAGAPGMVSSECEYSDNLDDNYMVDSDGFEGRHTETSFGFCAEITVVDEDGAKYSGYWWDSAVRANGYDPMGVARRALEMARTQIGACNAAPGRYTVVVENHCASRLAGPLIHALDGMSVQQGSSFLKGKLGEKVFGPHFSLTDRAVDSGRAGSRMFDTEGLATGTLPLIENGVVKNYLINTYASSLLGTPPTVEGVSRPCITPFAITDGEICNYGEKEITLDDICARVQSGLLVTGFNGGNCNGTTGNFSFGIEGFVLRDGHRAEPFREMVMTGNMVDLWNSLVAAGSDPRGCTRWQIPTLAFENIEINS